MEKKESNFLLKIQKKELTEHLIYSRLANKTKDQNNKKILKKIAKEELEHYNSWKKITKKKVKPYYLVVWFYTYISRLLGLSFGLKLLQKKVHPSKENCEKLTKNFSHVTCSNLDKQAQHKELLNKISEESVEYAGAMVLGLNDALVELTGALAGLTFALQNSRVVAITGLITGFAASLSMAASGYLSSREDLAESEVKNPIKSAIYTGVAYIITVIFLVAPYFIFKNIFVSLAVMLIVAILVIFAYTFYITTAKSLKFWKRFFEMSLISLSVAVISFGIGIILRNFLGVEV